jgi:HK97 family phage prohead protease
MPWHVEKRGDEWCVIKDADGESEGCHGSEAKAKRQLRALYASENQGGLMKTRNSEVVSIGVELSELELHKSGDQRTMVGYASAFNYPIPRDDGSIMFFDSGAWTRTLKNNRDQIQVLYHHGLDPEIGMKPLGVPIKMEQNGTGLWTETPLARTRYNEDTIIPLLESGALRSMSVQFAPTNWAQAEDGRHVTEAMLREFGPTPFPRNLGASAAVHSESLGEFLATGGETASLVGEKNQPETPSVVDEARLTWVMQASRSLELKEHELEEMNARIRALGRRDVVHAGDDPAASRRPGEDPVRAG